MEKTIFILVCLPITSTVPRNLLWVVILFLNHVLPSHGGRYAPIGRITSFHGSFIHQRQAGATETVVGGALDFSLNEDEDYPANLYAGMWYRFGDAFIPYVGIRICGN